MDKAEFKRRIKNLDAVFGEPGRCPGWTTTLTADTLAPLKSSRPSPRLFRRSGTSRGIQDQKALAQVVGKLAARKLASGPRRKPQAATNQETAAPEARLLPRSKL